jgi:hypothetical protein
MTTTDLVTRDPRAQEPLARLLQDEINRLLDRLAGALPDGTAATLAREDPDLAARIDAEEARLTELRAALLDGYRQWGDALQTLEDLWALRALKMERPDRLDRAERGRERRTASRPDARPDRRAA